MKKGKVRKYLRRADDCMEEIKRKMGCMDATLFFVLLGMESFYGQEDCYEVGMVATLRDYLKMLDTDDLTELHKILDELREM